MTPIMFPYTTTPTNESLFYGKAGSASRRTIHEILAGLVEIARSLGILFTTPLDDNGTHLPSRKSRISPKQLYRQIVVATVILLSTCASIITLVITTNVGSFIQAHVGPDIPSEAELMNKRYQFLADATL